MERGWREISPNCPRCGSTNTKFCYYNNYSLTQPRYFCKGCRRYWTKGGSLRNVPVGGGCRKSRRSRSSSLRLATSNNHHLNVGNSNILFGLGGHIGATSITNNQLGHNSYDTTKIMVESNNSPSSTNSEAPTIDLAVVYANFLNKKPENNIDNTIKLPQIRNEFEDSSIELPTKLNVSSHDNPSLLGMQHHHHHQQQQQHEPIMIGCAKDTPFSQGLTTLPYLGNDNKDHDNQRFLEEFSTPTHHTHQEEITSIDQQELGFPPLPGESSPWTPISSHDNHIANTQAPLRLPGLDPDPHQFSNLYIGNWSPLDLPGFETSSSSSMP